MENKELGRLVLKQVTEYPETFIMFTYGHRTPCHTVACLAGHAMLLSGYELRGAAFYRPDGTPVLGEASEAQRLLGMNGGERTVFYRYSQPQAIAEFRKMLKEED